MKLLFTFLLLFCLGTCFGQLDSSMCDCNSTLSVYRHTYIESNEVVYDSLYTSVTILLDFIGSYGETSPFILDIDEDGIVTVSDLLLILEGFGNTYTGDFDYCLVNVEYTNSHGWPSAYPGAYFTIVHTTLYDEDISNGDGWIICPVESVWIEVVYFNHPDLPNHVEKFYMK